MLAGEAFSQARHPVHRLGSARLNYACWDYGRLDTVASYLCAMGRSTSCTPFLAAAALQPEYGNTIYY